MLACYFIRPHKPATERAKLNSASGREIFGNPETSPAVCLVSEAACKHMNQAVPNYSYFCIFDRATLSGLLSNSLAVVLQVG